MLSWIFQSTLSLRRATGVYLLHLPHSGLFQSTLSLRRATWPVSRLAWSPENFNPRSPCGERQSLPEWRRAAFRYFNPRSPCGERPADVQTACSGSKFQSTLSLRRATLSLEFDFADSGNFNPRSPCGERHRQVASLVLAFGFQSTLSLRRATLAIDDQRDLYLVFQSTLSLRRATFLVAPWMRRSRNFNPRSPCGERQPSFTPSGAQHIFQSTLSLRRATVQAIHSSLDREISIHALLAESDDGWHRAP